MTSGAPVLAAVSARSGALPGVMTRVRRPPIPVRNQRVRKRSSPARNHAHGVVVPVVDTISTHQSARCTMTRTLALAAAAALAAALAVAPGGLAAPDGYTVLLGGAAPGGSYELSLLRHERIGSLTGLALNLRYTKAADGAAGDGNVFATGSLRAGHGVVAVNTRVTEAATVTANLVGGIVSARARTVRVTAVDGRSVRLGTRPDARFPRLLGSSVRFFAGDVLHLTASRVRRVVAYDARGKRIASKLLA
jgi:hypothetical protein